MSDTADAIRALLWPRSVAVIGASNDVSRWGGRTMQALLNLGYEGGIFPVNPKYDEVMGRACYGDVLDIPESVDIAVLVLSPAQTLPALRRCAEKGVRAAAVLSSGFAEASEEGRRHQDAIADFARESGVRLLGPNCLGLANLRHRISLGPGSKVKTVAPGGVALISQSGATATWLFSRAQDYGLRLSYLISSGNEADLDTADFVDFLADDELTSVICLHVEGLRRGEAFLEAAGRAIERGKPVVLLKIGTSPKGARAALSHTGSLAGSDRVLDGVCRQTGILRVETNEELLATALMFDRVPSVPASGIVVMAPSGGTCGLIADRCADVGLDLPELRPETAAVVAERLGIPFTANPIDLTSRPVYEVERVRDCLDLVAEDERYGLTLLVYTTTLLFDRLLPHAVEYAARSPKPLVVYCTAGSLADDYLAALDKAGVPVYTNLHDCVVAIRALVSFSERARSFERGPLETRATAAPAAGIEDRLNAGPLSEFESKAVLAAFGVPTTRERLAASLDEARLAAAEIGYPVAVKVVSPDIQHKTEIGAVRLGLRDEDQLSRAYADVLSAARTARADAAIDGVLVSEMVSGGLEAIAGVTRDPQFGPIILFGLGGIFAEVFQDVAVRRAPLSRADAEALVRELRGYPLLAGARGRPRLDIDALIEALLRLSDLAVALGPDLDQLDVNPLIVLEHGQGVRAADALVIGRAASGAPTAAAVGE